MKTNIRHIVGWIALSLLIMVSVTVGAIITVHQPGHTSDNDWSHSQILLAGGDGGQESHGGGKGGGGGGHTHG
jgi:hypothetical protein